MDYRYDTSASTTPLRTRNGRWRSSPRRRPGRRRRTPRVCSIARDSTRSLRAVARSTARRTPQRVIIRVRPGSRPALRKSLTAHGDQILGGARFDRCADRRRSRRGSRRARRQRLRPVGVDRCDRPPARAAGRPARCWSAASLTPSSTWSATCCFRTAPTRRARRFRRPSCARRSA